MPSVRSSPFTILHNQPRRRPCPENLEIGSCPRYNFSHTQITYSLKMAWQAKSGCAEHHRAAVERIANSFPVPWLLVPRTGEVLDNLEHCNRRLRAWASR